MEQHYLIPKSLVDAVLQYLVERPYKEVASGIAGLSALKAAPVDDEADQHAYRRTKTREAVQAMTDEVDQNEASANAE